MDGILNVYKEKGFTSHDVVAKLRGILRQRKIGHTGTLDPDAEGVLPICLGSATKLCDMLTDTSKTYQTTMLLGCVTDTQDISGKILCEKEVSVTEEEVRNAILSFVGQYDQIPPMYSAKKINGKKLYELAREGKELERPACQVEIYSITIDKIQLPKQIPPMYSAKKINGKKLYELAREGKELERPACQVEIYSITIDKIQLPKVTMTVSCSKGTYIRTLCHDIGAKLSCGACMTELLRTRVSIFSLEKAKKLSEIEALRDEGELEQVLLPIEYVFSSLPLIRVSQFS